VRSDKSALSNSGHRSKQELKGFFHVYIIFLFASGFMQYTRITSNELGAQVNIKAPGAPTDDLSKA